MQTIEQFVKGPIEVPWPVRGDAYTVASERIASPQAKHKSVYNFTNRRSPKDCFSSVALDGRMCLYGLTDFIQRELTKPVTQKDVELSKLFMSDAHSLGGPLDFDHEMWNRVVSEYGGYLPICINALPECSTFWINEPVIEVRSLGKGFGEIAAMVEAVLVGYVANATARLTLTRHLLERVRNIVQKHHRSYTRQQVDAVAQWMIHDFGFRASSTPQEAEIYGRASLLCFNGTDTFNAAFQAWANNASRPVGTSILALAHRIVMGYRTEDMAYEALVQASLGGMGSYVADCYDYHNAVTKFLTAMAIKAESTIVVRPDSGDYLENILFVVDKALEHDLYKMDENEKPTAKTLKFIQGDSMNWERISRVFYHLEKKNVDPTGWGIFGIGGWLRNTPNRDSLSSAYKLAAYGNDMIPCVKLSDTLAKVSVPGPSSVYRPTVVRSNERLDIPTVYLASESVNGSMINAMSTFYDGSMGGINNFRSVCLEDFEVHRKRTINQFDSYACVPINHGTPENPTLSRNIVKIQQETMKKYGKNSADYTY